jgi:hypothetical protein
MDYRKIESFIRKNVKVGIHDIDKKLYKISMLYRWFITQDNHQIKKITHGIYKVNCTNNRVNQLGSPFINSIINALQVRQNALHVHTSCTLDPRYGNLCNKEVSKLFIVLPIGEFQAIQTPLVKDLIELSYKSLPAKLIENNKPYMAKAFEHATKHFNNYAEDYNIVNNQYYVLKTERPYFLKAVEQVIVNSYSSIENNIYHHGEVLLYCSGYLLVDKSLIIDF